MIHSMEGMRGESRLRADRAIQAHKKQKEQGRRCENSNKKKRFGSTEGGLRTV